MDTPITLLSDELELIDATLHVDTIDGRLGLVFEARGGTNNREYALAVTIVLARLRLAGVATIEAFLVSGFKGGVAAPSLAGRQIAVDSRTVIDLRASEPDTLRRKIGRAVAAVREPTAKGSGNANKRIFVVAPEFCRTDWLATLDVTVPTEVESALFGTKVPGRDRALAMIAIRRGQSAFRQRLLAAYGGRCAVTGTTLEAVLEAAHIDPYDGAQTNRTHNGLLLRADVHTLFDLNLLGVSTDYRVVVGHTVVDIEYARFDGGTIGLPPRQPDRPSKTALAIRIETMRRLRRI